jgi:hypothetical protein
MTPLPARLVVRECAIALDGGSIGLGCADEAGRAVAVKLVQHAFPDPARSPGEIPGRLYLDGELVPVRSETEARLLDLLRAVEVPADDGPVPVAGEFVARVVRFVASDEYLRFAERVEVAAEMAADPARYEVQVDWDEATRNRVLVRLAGVLGVSLAVARAFLTEGRPLEGGLGAAQVAGSVARYRDAGLPVRVVPPFRWRLP